jgi:hypothetical protein
MAWRGVEDDQHLYWAVSFDGNWWSRQLLLSDRPSAGAPALAVFQDTLFMAWRGAAPELGPIRLGDDNLWWATYDGNADLNWSDQHQLTDRGSDSGPALAVFQGNFFMAWRGVPGDDNLYWATYDQNDPRKWTDQHPLNDRASFGVPALAAFQDKLFMAWRGVPGDEDLYWATYDGNADLKWSDQNPLTDRASAVGPALTVFQNKLYMVWRGIGGDESDEKLYWATYDENNPRKWTDQTVMETTTAEQTGTVVLGSVQRPSLAVFQNSIFVAGVGLETVSSAGSPGTGNSDSLAPGPNPDPNGPPLPQGPDPGIDQPPPPPPPKGIFYTNFDGNIPALPIILFQDRASEAPVAQAVYFNIPLSLKNVMLKHGFDASRGFREFNREMFPAGSIRAVPLRALTGF